MKKTKLTKAIDAKLQHDVDSVVSGSRDTLSTVAKQYMQCVVDPKGAKTSGIPTLMGGTPRRTSVVRVKSVGVMTTDAVTGYGFCAIDPDWSGPYSDRTIGVSSTSTPSVGNWSGASTIPPNPTSGVTELKWVDAEFVAATMQNQDLAYRVVSCGIYITPVSKNLDQGGKIYFHEVAGHASTPTMTLGEVQSSKSTRSITGLALRDDRKIVLNWHPQSMSLGTPGRPSPYEFHVQVSPNTGGGASFSPGPLIVMATGEAAAVSYEIEVVAVYEVIGLKAKNLRPRLTDARGMDLTQAAFATKHLSGWVGHPQHVEQGYLAAAFHWAQRLGAKASRFYSDNKDTVRQVAALAGMAL